MKEFNYTQLEDLERGTNSSFAQYESDEPEEMPDFFMSEQLSAQEHVKRFSRKGLRTLVVAAVGVAGFGLNKLGEHMEKDSKLPKVVTTGIRAVGKLAVIGSGIMTPLLTADTAIAGYEYIEADNASERERMDIIHDRT